MTPLDQALQAALAHHRAGRPVEAQTIYRRILAADPGQPDTLHLLGVLCGQIGRPQEAVDLITRALASRPDWPEALNNLGLALRSSGRADAAVQAYQRAVALRPDWPQAHNDLSVALQSAGRVDEAVAAFRRAILLRGEQGYGDALQWVRYVPLVARRGGRVIVECLDGLRRLLQQPRRGDWASVIERLAQALRDKAHA